MKIISWNVNGIRAISKKGFHDFVQEIDADIICLQETKANVDQLDESLLSINGYTSYWSSAEKKGYSGVAVYTKEKPIKIEKGIGIDKFDKEGRILRIDYETFILFNIYFPNGGSANKRVDFKMEFCESLLSYLNKLNKQSKKIILCGDVNTAHMEIDLSRPKENEKNTGFLPQERAWLTKFLDSGFIDTFRHLNSEPQNYTWWDYKTKARERNIGWRIDYFIISKNLLLKLKKAYIMNSIFGSDHCPIAIEINI